MAKEVIMPALGMAQETGILMEWLKSEGESVTKGDLLMAVETDKATMEVEAQASGVLANVTAVAGDEIPVGEVIALILAPGETAPEKVAPLTPEPTSDAAVPATSPNKVTPVAQRVAAVHNVDVSQISKPDGRRIQKEDVLAYAQQSFVSNGGAVLASPKARRLAQEHQLDLATLQGSGPDGAVLAADVETAVMTQPAAMPETAVTKPDTPSLSKLWQVMARRLTESWQTVPHFYLTRTVNASQLLAWRQNVLQRSDVRITITDLLVKIVASALRQHPRVNASWLQDNIIYNEAINVGLAVAVEEGLIVPVIHHANQLRLQQIATNRQEIVDRALNGRSSVTDLQDGTFTISNLGMFGIDKFNAIVNPPQAAILAVGRISDQVVPLNDTPTIQPMMTLNLSLDHRVVDGARGAQFLQTVVNTIEDPMLMLD